MKVILKNSSLKFETIEKRETETVELTVSKCYSINTNTENGAYIQQSSTFLGSALCLSVLDNTEGKVIKIVTNSALPASVFLRVFVSNAELIISTKATEGYTAEMVYNGHLTEFTPTSDQKYLYACIFSGSYSTDIEEVLSGSGVTLDNAISVIRAKD